MSKLKRIKLEGFRSIKEMTLELRPLNVLIGANGAGKSNLIAFFKLVNELMGGRLQKHIGATGRSTANLHFGPKVTPQLEAEMVFEVENGTDTYRMRLFHAAGDSLIFAEEILSFQQRGYPSPKFVSLGAAHQETRIGDDAFERPLRKTRFSTSLPPYRPNPANAGHPSPRVVRTIPESGNFTGVANAGKCVAKPERGAQPRLMKEGLLRLPTDEGGFAGIQGIRPLFVTVMPANG